MYKIFTTIVFTTILNVGMAQTKSIKIINKATYRCVTIEPGIGSHLMGNPDIQISNLLQFNFQKRFSVISHTVLGYSFENPRITDIKQNYSYTIFQKFGIGLTLYKQRTSSTFSFLAGIKYDTYSGTLHNDQLPEKITTKTSSYSPDYGFMYNLKTGSDKYFFSGRIYIPVKGGLPGMVENANLEFGIGIRLK